MVVAMDVIVDDSSDESSARSTLLLDVSVDVVQDLELGLRCADAQ